MIALVDILTGITLKASEPGGKKPHVARSDHGRRLFVWRGALSGTRPGVVERELPLSNLPWRQRAPPIGLPPAGRHRALTSLPASPPPIMRPAALSAISAAIAARPSRMKDRAFRAKFMLALQRSTIPISARPTCMSGRRKRSAGSIPATFRPCRVAGRGAEFGVLLSSKALPDRIASPCNLRHPFTHVWQKIHRRQPQDQA